MVLLWSAPFRRFEEGSVRHPSGRFVAAGLAAISLAAVCALAQGPQTTTSQGSAEVRATFFVATDGNDRWSGKLAAPNGAKTDGPFATLERARDAVRQVNVKNAPAEPITVMVRGGKYFLKSTLTLGPKDSGSKDRPIVYTAYPGEKPVLSGGRKLTGWKPYRGKIVKCEVPATKAGAWKFRQLFMNGEPLIRARYPNFDPQDPLYGGYLHAEGAGAEKSYTLLRYRTGSFTHHWAKPAEGEVFLWDAHDWGYTKTIPISSVSEAERIIELARPIKSFNVRPWFWETPIGEGERFYVENLLEELDEPGEWYLDTDQASTGGRRTMRTRMRRSWLPTSTGLSIFARPTEPSPGSFSPRRAGRERPRTPPASKAWEQCFPRWAKAIAATRFGCGTLKTA
jgi:hypothetical protein